MCSGTGADSLNYGIGQATSASPTGPFVKYPGNPIVISGIRAFGFRQCRCGPPPQQHPQEPEFALQAGASLLPPVEEAKTDSFFDSFTEPQCGHLVPFQSFERTRISLSLSHFSQ
jgi:hypothetical protein